MDAFTEYPLATATRDYASIIDHAHQESSRMRKERYPFYSSPAWEAIGRLEALLQMKDQEIDWLVRQWKKAREELAHMTQLLDRPEYTARAEDYI